MTHKGVFINFEGIDGSGSSSHVHELARRIENYEKYLDIIRTHEPWKSHEIRRKISSDRDSYSGGFELAKLYVEDRTNHVADLIMPALELGTIILNARYKMSTCAYQWVQGVSIEELLRMHKHRNLPKPNLTFYLDVPRQVAEQRIKQRGKHLEKFETNPEFIDKLILAYQTLVQMAKVDERIFGKVISIDGNREIGIVADEIFNHFLLHLIKSKS